MTTIQPQCFFCKHLAEDDMKCTAFPDEIPMEIMLNKHDHHQPYPGDHGILFEEGGPLSPENLDKEETPAEQPTN